MLFIEASAKTKEGVQCAFEELIEKVYKLFVIFKNMFCLDSPNTWSMAK